MLQKEKAGSVTRINTWYIALLYKQQKAFDFIIL